MLNSFKLDIFKARETQDTPLKVLPRLKPQSESRKRRVCSISLQLTYKNWYLSDCNRTVACKNVTTPRAKQNLCLKTSLTQIFHTRSMKKFFFVLALHSVFPPLFWKFIRGRKNAAQFRISVMPFLFTYIFYFGKKRWFDKNFQIVRISS